MSGKTIEDLRRIETPPELSRNRVASLIAQGLLGEALRQLPFVDEATRILESEEFGQLCRGSKITVAMIKPNLPEAMTIEGNQLQAINDLTLANLLFEQIKPPLEIVFSFSVMMTPQLVDQFYAGDPRKRQEPIPPIDKYRYGKVHQNRWQEYNTLMTSGPVTFALLYSQDGRAIEHWRRQIGDDWNVERVKQTYPNSLRARFGRDNHNNLLHGSDSPESSQREINHLVAILKWIGGEN